MPAPHLDLIVTADSARGVADLELRDAAGVRIAARSVDFGSIRISRKQALFDLRSYLRLYVEPGHEEEEVAKVGVFLAEEILGEEIFRRLWDPKSQRHLRVQLPRATAGGNPLGAALTRIPWEIARPSPARETLAERNLLVRVVHDMREPPSQPLDLGADGCLRVLFVFAAARRSQPLSTRRERREIQKMFEREVYPERKIVVDFLAHGVTRDQLREQVKVRSGYHVVHWSGHGHLDQLELSGIYGIADHLSGQELVDLFADAGGFLPQLVVLSACQSGDVQQVRDWQSFLATARGEEPGTRAAFKDLPERDIEIVEQPGYTGAAHALLQGGVPSVIAMRYAVGDEYARALALELHRTLFVDTDPKSAAAALTMARKALLAKDRPDATRFAAADHATPVLYGAEDPGLRWSSERSPSLDTRDRRLHRIAELTLAEHPGFVGRGWELASLGSRFISTAQSTDARPVAVITGLGGMGKTALAAEAFDLWNRRFQWVVLYQAKPNPLGFETMLRDLHLRLYAERGLYYRHVQEWPADAILREADSDFTGSDRITRLTQNLARELRDEAILLVLDNFESNLKPEQEPGDAAEPLWACQDPDWDRCLSLLATELVGAPSRVLITCRRQLAALAGDAAPHCLRVRLSPLLAGEAALYLREHEGLSRMVFGGDEAEKALAERLLQASRFHPLLMDRLARLATGGPDLREQLLAALDAIETNRDATKLPELFAIERGDKAEVAYLENALAISIDELIHGASPDARRLLWMIAVANEPVALDLIEHTWSGPSLMPLLELLVAIGLVNEDRSGPESETLDLTSHELVRERIRAWMVAHPEDRADLTEKAIRLAYAERLEAAFMTLEHQDLKTALEAGRRALIYCVQAEAWDRLRRFASRVVTGFSDPLLLEGLIPTLQSATESAPEGWLRWSCLALLAAALKKAGNPTASLPPYEQAAAQARSAAEAGGSYARQAWSDLAMISSNWAFALVAVGHLDAARQRELDSVEAYRRAGDSEIRILGTELEVLRLDALQGRAAETLPEIESQLARLESWWEQRHAGIPAVESTEVEFLARSLIGVLDTAAFIHVAQDDWEPALRRFDAMLRVKRELQRPAEDLALDRRNRANALGHLGRREEAKAELESCLEIFRNDPAQSAMTLSSLADLFAEEGDLSHAIDLTRRGLAARELLPDPDQRATSHHSLAVYLARRGHPTDAIESLRHRLAALVYSIVAGFEYQLRAMMGGYIFHFRRAYNDGTELAVPRLAELLAVPAFRPLKRWLRSRRVRVMQVQEEVDGFLEAAREAALATARPSHADR